jgi:threonine dehydrogenase-like Zn-dependent dehydrogenase
VAMSMRAYPDRVRLAQEFGADEVTTGGDAAALRRSAEIQNSDGFDLVIDAVGTQQAALAALALARRGGKVLLYGLTSAAIDQFPLGEVIFRNLTLYGRTSAPTMWEPAIGLMGRGAVRLKALIGEVVALEDVPSLLVGKESGGPVKRVVRVKK